MNLPMCRDALTRNARKLDQHARPAGRRRARPSIESLETLQLMSWASVPPALIAPPVANPPSTYVYTPSVSTAGDANGSNNNLHGEVDFYKITAPVAGYYLFDASSPGHAVDTVIAVYDSSGHRLAYNDDVASGNHDSETTAFLAAGQQYSLGVTNYASNTTHGAYNWSIDGPAHDAIELKARSLGSAFTGTPVTNLQSVSGGYRIQYQNADIYYAPSAGAHVVYGAIRAEYAATANEQDVSGYVTQSILGVPTSDEMNVPGVSGARMNTFQGGAIYWSSTTGAHVVYGAIGAKYNSLGGAAAYGLPISDETGVSGLAGVRVSQFQNGGDIYWSSATGAHAVYGSIGSLYNNNNIQRALGAATTDEMDVPGYAGFRQTKFQRGIIFWSARTGAYVSYY